MKYDSKLSHVHESVYGIFHIKITLSKIDYLVQNNVKIMLNAFRKWIVVLKKNILFITLCSSGLGSCFKLTGGNMFNGIEMNLLLNVQFKGLSLFHGASLMFFWRGFVCQRLHYLQILKTEEVSSG